MFKKTILFLMLFGFSQSNAVSVTWQNGAMMGIGAAVGYILKEPCLSKNSLKKNSMSAEFFALGVMGTWLPGLFLLLPKSYSVERERIKALKEQKDAKLHDVMQAELALKNKEFKYFLIQTALYSGGFACSVWLTPEK